MPFSLEIKNFGKLTDATIDIGHLTILAGPNNTGKSYVSKLLYSVFDATNANHAKLIFDNLTRTVKDNLHSLNQLGYNNDFSPLSLLSKNIEEITKIANSGSEYKYQLDALSEIHPTLNELINEMDRNFKLMEGPLTSWLEQAENQDIGKAVLKQMHEQIEFMRTLIGTGPSGILTSGIILKANQNIIQNFQTPGATDLIGNFSEISHIKVDGIGEFRLGPKKEVGFSVSGTTPEPESLRRWQQFSRVIYLESPIYWKLRNALENIHNAPRFLFQPDREHLNGVPGYFYDLAKALREQYSGDIAFPELLNKLIAILGGKITLSETGELLFSESGKTFSMHLTATGVVNLGILALLIERKVLDKGTFLFIDEPEAHLHPAWQVVMAETLFELARQGVNVVIATHSADILKWIEVHTKEHPEDRQLIALNHFTPEGVKSGEEDFEVKLADIKKSLTEPFLNLYLKGLSL